MDLRTLFGPRFVDLRDIWSLGMGVGSDRTLDVQSLSYARKGMQRVSAGTVEFQRGEKGLRDEKTEVRRGIEWVCAWIDDETNKWLMQVEHAFVE